MLDRIDNYGGVGAPDDVRGDDASGADAELDELRRREQQLSDAYRRAPHDPEAQRALVQVQQRIRSIEQDRARNGFANAPDVVPAEPGAYAHQRERLRHDEHARWIADNGPLDAAFRKHGLAPPSVGTATETLDMTTPASAFKDAEQIKKQIKLADEQRGNPLLTMADHLALFRRLGELRTRLAEVERERSHAPPKPPVTVPRGPGSPLGHGDCHSPEQLAMPGNAARVAEAGVDLESALQGATHLTTPELERYIDAYIAYTATKPELRALHDRAVARGPVILADRFEADETAAEAAHKRALMEAHVEDQKRLLVVRPPLPIQQRAAVGEVAIPIAQVVETVAKLHPIVDALLTALETATGREMAGLGPKMDDGERAMNAFLLLAPLAGTVLVGGVREAAALVRIARATGRTPQEMRMILVSARELEKQRALVIRAFDAKKSGRALSAAEGAAVARARALVSDFGGVSPHGQTPLAKLAYGGPITPAAVGTPKATAPGATRVIGDAEASFALDVNGVTLQARGEIEGPHAGRKKGYVPKPQGGLQTGDHRGHLIPEGGVREPRKVNVQPNIVSEAARSNLGPKKKFDNLASEIARANPGKKVETVHDPVRVPGALRPVATVHRILVDGVEVHRVVIENK